MKNNYDEDIVERVINMEYGSEIFLFYSTKEERNTVVSYLKQQMRFLYKELDDLGLLDIVIEKVESTDGKPGVKISKGTKPPIAGFVIKADGSINNLDL